jgi:hypothetical protein
VTALGATALSNDRVRVRGGVARSRADPGAPVKDQIADAGDDGQRHELGPQQPVRLTRDGKEGRGEQHRYKQ